jgi:hypothetical protein
VRLRRPALMSAALSLLITPAAFALVTSGASSTTFSARSC